MKRFYCWRVGAVFEINVGDKCPECGCIDHNIYEEDNCGNFVELPMEKRVLNQGAGTHCILPISHPGQCSWNRDIVAENIHES